MEFNELFEIFDPADLSARPNIPSEVIAEARAALFGFMRPAHVIEKRGEFDYASMSSDAKKLLTRCINRAKNDLKTLKSRGKKHIDEDAHIDDGVVQMIMFTLLNTRNWTMIAYNLGYGEPKYNNVANELNAVAPMLDALKEKLK